MPLADASPQVALLREIAANTGLPLRDQLERALSKAADLLGVDVVALNRADGQTITVEATNPGGVGLTVGDSFPLDETYCALTLEQGELVVIDADAESGASDAPCFSRSDFKTYIGMPVPVMGETYGALCLLACSVRPHPFTAEERDLVRFLGPWVGTVVERGRDAEAFSESQARLRAVVEHTPVVVFALDDGDRFTMLRGSALADLGIDPADWLGERWDARDGALAPLVNGRRIDLRREPSRWQAALGGRFYDCQLALGDAGLTGIALDVTDRQAATTRAETAARRLRRILDSAPEAVVLAHPDRTIAYINPAFEALFGIAAEEAVGRSTASFYADPADFDRQGRLRLDDTFQLRPQPFLLNYRRADGTTFTGETVAGWVPGEPPLLMGFFRDVTRREELRDRETAAAAAEADAVKAKERFLANMSHEMRTPLNAVTGLSNLLARTALSPDQAGLVEGVKTSADTLLSLIDDLLDFARMEAGGLPIEAIPYAPADVLADVHTILRARADDRGIALRCDISGTVPATVVGDPTRLRQIALNLASNAVRFTEIGSVQISLDAVAADDGHRLTLEVADTGIGIPADRRQAIFEPFTQASSDAARRFGGTGLGLAIVSELVERQGGTVSVESTLGTGSTFRVELPVGRADALALPVPPAHVEGPSDLTDLRVLVVEDNQMNRFVARRMLEGWGVTVTEARDGREAVRAVADDEEGRLDLVLMDLQMPEMDGIAATRYIRGVLGVGSDTLPILALTASVLASQHGDVVAAGLDDFLLKPFDPDTLRSRIGAWTGRVAPEPSAEPAVDLDEMARFTNGDPDLARQIAGLFLTNGRDSAQALAAAFDAGDTETVGSVAHMMKGQAGYVGALALAETADSLITAARADDRVTVASAVPVALRQFEAAADELARLYPSAPSPASAMA